MKTILKYDQVGHERFIKNLKTIADILPEAVRELKKQGVEIPRKLTFQSLKDGDFIEAFNKFHKSQMLKNDLTKKMIYSKYLDLYGYSTTLIESLEEKFKINIQREYMFYVINHDFYHHCESFRYNNIALREIYEKAPKKKSYTIYDFVKVNGNRISIEVPKDLFTLFATNKKQESAIVKVSQLINIAQELELDYNSVKNSLKEFLVKDRHEFGPPNRTGLSRDFKIINFDYNKILQIQ